ncbi:phospho-N-acetylmuramoyl-pentapeptide-transferase [Schleiferia thermophila]|jgi:phospho-N-acetylmuramoyl-pentapeptide-transferase|uniref:Phospho-N-acetylmuramoyl-pentapeptide-transferase n=1 Tax=Schleiferia thermophila TaxID=884107 RepID=A0A369A9I1_9FLAO|nr:phospho-N-acetylmuramoyl-pentapeptide-transferase [Schleiferia thermophila]KFD38789.1 phospho-N-acetylmuramoyl-pentapeptide-transferase [Schleiferia thermophila str. Yellowstone]PMB31346.1 phospho-N-acetylmuramoyl-pentapeptide-transferase [Fischerella thermalis CCMEE 5319]RCX04747.1 phospho-N-acetylmuramoyl-pentapeptide-transferase [Schleiferia thermophila]GCD79724.1 phospho-N-acetylmuramoyl-pentapeptide-transferase [Schleiferia thermophila]
MLYYLFDYLNDVYDLPGAGVFQYITFRASMSVIGALFITMIFGKRIILILRRKQVGETVRNLGLAGENLKAGTPTMGGLIILGGIMIPVLLFARLDNVYVILLLVSTVWMGIIGFIDDYIKVFKKDKKGLRGKFKVLGQVVLGLIVGTTLYFHPEVTIKEKTVNSKIETLTAQIDQGKKPVFGDAKKSIKTTIPFLKNNELDYSKIIEWTGLNGETWGWVVFIPIVIFIITAVSNGANLTDGLDGLATGTSAISAVALGIFAYVSGSIIFADYLNIMYIPNSGEMVVFVAALIGACIGFLWYNTYPAQVFMGDTGSLALGGILATLAIAVRKELLIPIVCGIFLVENLSVVLQVSYFKYTRRKFGEGRRIFLMAPLHHHFQKKGYHEAKIVTRFWIVGIMLAVIAFVTLKIR